MEQYIFLKEAVSAFENAKCTFGISFSIISLNSSIHKYNKNTFDALFLWIYSALFTQQIASHRLRRSAVWHCVQWGLRERERGRKRERAIWIGVWSTLKRFFPGCLHGLIKSTPLAQTLVAMRESLWCCCHGFPAGPSYHQLMPD